MRISVVTDYLESIAPLSLQESYDNAGMIIGDREAECTGVLCTLDVTTAVVEEAVARNCNCILSHHPVIFRGLTTIRSSDHTGEAVIAAIKNEVAIYASHTNLDNVISGVNGKIASKLGLSHRAVMSGPSEDTGSGLIGTLATSLTPQDFLNKLFYEFEAGVVRHTAPTGKPINRVAVCGGAGSFLISKALELGADAFVTADLKYHEFFPASGRLLLCDIGHYESEQFTTDLFLEILLQKFPTFAVLKSEVKTNPVRYFTGK